MLEDLTPQDLTSITAAIAAACALVTVVCLLLVRKSVRLVESTFHVKVPAQVVTQLEGFARIGANYVEELGRKWLLGLIPSAPQTPQEKVDAAVHTARSLAPDGLATFSDEQIAIAVQAQLPSIRPAVEAALPIVAGSKSLAPPAGSPSLVPSAPLVPSIVGAPSSNPPTTFVDTEFDADLTTSPQTPSSKRGA